MEPSGTGQRETEHRVDSRLKTLGKGKKKNWWLEEHSELIRKEVWKKHRTQRIDRPKESRAIGRKERKTGLLERELGHIGKLIQGP